MSSWTGKRTLVGWVVLLCIPVLVGCPQAAKESLIDPLALGLPFPKIDGTPNPVLCTFEGTVYSVDDGAGAAAAASPPPIIYGTPVTYQVRIGLNNDGYVTDNDRNLIKVCDTLTQDYFFAEYASGSLINQVNGGYYNDSQDLSAIRFGVNSLLPTGTNTNPKGMLVVGSNDNSIILANVDLTVSQWTFGTNIVCVEEAHDNLGTTTEIVSWLTLTGIEGQTPPPPPQKDDQQNDG